VLVGRAREAGVAVARADETRTGPGGGRGSRTAIARAAPSGGYRVVPVHRANRFPAAAEAEGSGSRVRTRGRPGPHRRTGQSALGRGQQAGVRAPARMARGGRRVRSGLAGATRAGDQRIVAVGRRDRDRGAPRGAPRAGAPQDEVPPPGGTEAITPAPRRGIRRGVRLTAVALPGRAAIRRRVAGPVTGAATVE
jgi:hypothetical protein